LETLNSDSFIGRVDSYSMDGNVPRGYDLDPMETRGFNFYRDRAEAEKASRFLPVTSDEETWKLAVGDRDTENPRYEIEESDLGVCCEDISFFRDMLYACQEDGGAYSS